MTDHDEERRFLNESPLLSGETTCITDSAASGNRELLGCGRNSIFLGKVVYPITQVYDRANSPFSKSHSRTQLVSMSKKKSFVEKETYLQCFHVKVLNSRILKWLHRYLDSQIGFMFYASLSEPCAG
jgi:hypothetical protein